LGAAYQPSNAVLPVPVQAQQQLCQKLRGAHCLKAEVSSSIAEQSKAVGEVDLGVAALRQGLEACAQGQNSSER
jgi:hypothetical protein